MDNGRLVISSLKIRHLLIGIVMVISSISFMFIIWKVLEIRDDLAEAEWIDSANILADRIMQANAVFGSEQSLTLIMLRQSEMVTKENLSRRSQLLQEGNAHIATIVPLAGKIAQRDPYHPLHTSLQLLEERKKKLDTARDITNRIFDDALGIKEFEFDETVIQEPWSKTIGNFIGALASIRRDAFTPEQEFDKAFRDNLEVKEILFQITRFASMESSLIGEAIAQGQPLTENDIADLQSLRGNIRYYLDRLLPVVATKNNISISNNSAIDAFLGQYEQLRQTILAASSEGMPYPVDATQWFEKAAQGIEAILSISEHINQRTQKSVSLAIDQQWQQAGILAGFSILVLLAVFITGVIINRRFLIPLGQLAAASDQIAHGELDAPVAIRSNDEFGALGQSFEKMRVALVGDRQARKQAEENLKNSEKRTRDIINAAADSIISFDERGMIESFNLASVRIFGYGAEKVTDKNIKILIPPPLHDKDGDYMGKYLLTGETEVASGGVREVVALRKNGEIFPLELAITEITSGTERLFICVSRDITRRKEFEATLAMARDEALDASKTKSEFLANMSHELRTPLNAIIGFSEMLLKELDGPLNDEQKNSTQFIVKSGKNLLTLINDILDMSKIEAGKMEIAPEAVEISEVVDDSLKSINVLFREKGLALKNEVMGDLPVIQADPVRVKQIMLNLLSNAAKFTDEGEVVVRCREIDAADPELPGDISSALPPKSHWIMISVKDNGIGIAQVNIPKVFEEFRQVHGGSTRKVGGTGLGMPISKRFVEMHGGKMWLTSVEGQGTTFYFILPVDAIKHGASEPSPDSNKGDIRITPEIATVGQGKARVLIIEDDPALMALNKRSVMDAGCDVSGVMNGSEVMSEVEAYKPDVILLDLMLPGKDGWQILKELKADHTTNNIPVIICSALDHKNLGLSLGAAEYFVKPVDGKALVNAINKYRGDIKNIFIIDDDNKAIKLARALLEQNGFLINEAASGREGLERMAVERPDLVLLDLNMPEMDGFAVLEAMKQDPALSRIPVIVVTAMDLNKEQIDRLQGGVNVVQKTNLSDEATLNMISKTLKMECKEET